MTLTHVMTPITIGSLQIKNRVLRSAHTTAIGGGTLSDDLIAYHEARARGGVGLSIIEAMSVHPSSLSALNIIDPSLAEKYPRMMDRLRPYGMRVFQQLFHAGQYGRNLDGGPPWAPSDQPGMTTGVAPIPMTKMMIDTIVESYAKTSEKLESWGCEGVELHCGHGFLPQQFLSSYANDRTDEYGGSLENRARFTMETLRAIRDSVSKDFVVGLRLSPDMLEGGVDVATNLAMAQMAEAAGLIDFLSISSGTFQTMDKTIGGMHEPMGFELPVITPITSQISVPTMIVGRFRTLEEADQSIRAGDGDMVSMVRATIADPDLVEKTLEGHSDRVRPCIGCNQGCIGQLQAPPNRMGCLVNPAVGFEQNMGDDKLNPAETPLKILIVGGGPAGMEAARAAALRGHQVILAEAESELGGAAKYAAMAPTRSGMRDILIWLQDEIYRLGVDVRTSTYMDAEDIRRETPDKVILATGSYPRMDGIQLSNPAEPIREFAQPHVISSYDLFQSTPKNLGKTAVIIDDSGHYEAIGCAEFLQERGVHVHFISRHISFAPMVEAALMTEPALRRLSEGGFDLHLRTRVISIAKDHVMAGPVYLPADHPRSMKIPADLVVFVSRNGSLRDLADELQAEPFPVSSIGDALSPRFLLTAIREGHLAGASV